jgi:hypothetical protein
VGENNYRKTQLHPQLALPQGYLHSPCNHNQQFPPADQPNEDTDAAPTAAEEKDLPVSCLLMLKKGISVNCMMRYDKAFLHVHFGQKK